MKMLNKVLIAVSAGVVAAGVAMPASAAVVSTFSDDFAGWSTAAGGSAIVEDFSDASLVSGLSIIFGSSRPGSISAGSYLDRADDTQAVKPVFDFSSAITAFGANWDLSPGGAATGISLFLTFQDLTSMTVTTQVPNAFTGQFFGIVSDTPFISVRFDEGTQTAGVETFNMDNARFVQAAAVPEPSMFSLLGLGLAGVGFSMRKRSIK